MRQAARLRNLPSRAHRVIPDCAVVVSAQVIVGSAHESP